MSPYIEPPTIPEGMTMREYRASRTRPAHRRLLISVFRGRLIFRRRKVTVG